MLTVRFKFVFLTTATSPFSFSVGIDYFLTNKTRHFSFIYFINRGGPLFNGLQCLNLGCGPLFNGLQCLSLGCGPLFNGLQCHSLGCGPLINGLRTAFVYSITLFKSVS